MKIQLLSDLHLEANPGFVPTPAPDADLLVLAGDIGSYQTRRDGSVMDEPDWGLQRFSPLPQFAAWPVPVLFVPGNHEYDALDIDQAHADLRACCERLGIQWLERETTVIDGVRFVGTTLWSDYDTFAQPGAPLTEQLKQRHKAFRAANFYLHKMAGQRGGVLFDAAAMRALALDCQAWLREALAQPHADGPTVVVTHFAPTLHSADPRYGHSPGTAGFCNALDELLPHADWWLHGHLHCPTDTQVGRCRIVANPLGYASKGEQLSFRPWLTLAVAQPAPAARRPPYTDRPTPL
jgi:Icc-related predicted phosphoesterase